MIKRTDQPEHPPPEQKPKEAKCNFRYCEHLCYLKAKPTIEYTEYGKCDGEENCVLFMIDKEKSNER